MDDEARRSIIRSAREILAARGSPVEGVELDGDELVVTSLQQRRRAPLGELARAWHVLPAGDRSRRLAVVVENVAPPTGPTLAKRGIRAPGNVVAWAVAATLVLFAIATAAWARSEVIAAGARRRARETVEPPPDSSAHVAQRQQAVCTGVRKRVTQGAGFGPYDSAGWVVEIWLGREDGALTPASAQLATLADAKRVPADLDAGLAAIEGELVVTELPVPPGATESARAGGALIQLHGAYAAAYLDPVQRARFVALADRLYDSTGANLGALWGRCGELPWHDLGAWYRGSDRGAAAGAMLFMSGRYSDSGAVPATARDGSANTLGAFVTRARASADDRALALAIEDVGGKIAMPTGRGATIAFPLGGYTLATRASRELMALLDR